MERLDPRQLNHHAAALAVWSYAVAKLPELLPRNEAAPSPTSTAINSSTLVIYALMGIGLFVVTTLVFVRIVAKPTTPGSSYNGLDDGENVGFKAL